MLLNPANNNSTSLCNTANYEWSTADVLGYGATGFVFKGREKKSGKEYAVKVFNSLGVVARPAKLRKREFEVLKKVNHPNVVHLCDVEEEVSTKQEVIIMELCSAGNLFTMVNDDPEYLYGFRDEKEFIRLLSHITAGMKHLHDLEIVHRDVKPGNIMRSYAEDGTSVYKLTDFGAARELGDNEQFQSLYGTEEYLHPDIYERAILRKPQGKKFSATVDLWSLGVTLFHVATGQLPFRPYGGARKNKEMMYQIITEKPLGAISGVQTSKDGPIEWSKELPKTCRLSEGLKLLLTPILSGILECDPHKIWTFDRYFAEVDAILNKTVIDVFSIPSAMLHKVYISPEKTLASFQEHVTQLTDIRSSQQLLLYEGTQFKIEAYKPVNDYPKTSPEYPFVLLNVDLTDFHSIRLPHTCKPPEVKLSISIKNDSSLAKVCSCTLFDIGTSVEYLMLVQQLIRLGVKWFVSYLRNQMIKIQLFCCDLQRKVRFLKTSLEIFEEHYTREASLLRVLSMLLSTPPEVNELKLYFTQVTEKTKHLRQIRTEFGQISEKVRKLGQAVIKDKTPASVFVDQGSHAEDKLSELMEVRCNQTREIYRFFRKQKLSKHVSDEEEQLHKFEKQRLAKICEASIELFMDRSVPPCKRLHKSSRRWFRDMNEYLQEIQQSEMQMSKLSDACVKEAESVRSLQRIYRDKLSLVETVLREAAARPQSSTLLCTNNSVVNIPTNSNSSSSNLAAATSNHVSAQQMHLRELKKGLIEAKNRLLEVKSEVKTGSDLLRRLGSINCASNLKQSAP